ncbi:MAG: carboxylating nicotinate-nucleotide diphosphorylase [Planctomycetota bacterium]
MDTSLEEFWSRSDVRRQLDTLIEGALEEDRVSSDGATVIGFGEGLDPARATITAGEPGVICGSEGAVRVFRAIDPNIRVIDRRRDGEAVQAEDVVLVIEGTIRALLGAERSALNWLGYLSGIASRTADWVARAPGVAILDTRKTLPGWRDFSKHAVRAGGGTNHRRDLEEFPMFKENHRDLFRKGRMPAGATPDEEMKALVAAHRNSPFADRPLEIEVEDYESFRACLESGVDWILIDNQTPDEIRRWIERGEREIENLPADWKHRLEASGGVTGETVASYAEVGVGRISIGSLTHSVPSLDLSLHVEWIESS